MFVNNWPDHKVWIKFMAICPDDLALYCTCSVPPVKGTFCCFARLLHCPAHSITTRNTHEESCWNKPVMKGFRPFLQLRQQGPRHQATASLDIYLTCYCHWLLHVNFWKSLLFCVVFTLVNKCRHLLRYPWWYTFSPSRNGQRSDGAGNTSS